MRIPRTAYGALRPTRMSSRDGGGPNDRCYFPFSLESFSTVLNVHNF